MSPSLVQQVGAFAGPSRLARAALGLLPRSLRFEALRSLARVDTTPPAGLVIKIAETRAEFEAAFKLLHAQQATLAKQTGGQAPQEPSEMSVTPWHALPGTRVVIAMLGERVVATVSVIRDTPFGFPLDRVLDLSHLRRFGARLAQVTSMAWSEELQSCRGGGVLFPLLKYLYEYCIRCFGVDYLVIATPPAQADYFEAVFYFERLDQGPLTGGDASPGAGRPAVGLMLDLRSAYKRFATTYGKRSASGNLFRYFAEFRIPGLEFPERQRFKTPEPGMSPELLSEFCVERVPVMNRMTERERSILCSLYDQARYGHVLPRCEASSRFTDLRRDPRFGAEAEGRIIFARSRIVKMRLKDASTNGFQAWLEEPIRFGTEIKASIAVDGAEIADLDCQPVWTDDRQVYGFSILSSSANWGEFIERLRARDRAKAEAAATEDAPLVALAPGRLAS
jgi:hypothetical protein